jgi:hypothetical protein
MAQRRTFSARIGGEGEGGEIGEGLGHAQIG